MKQSGFGIASLVLGIIGLLSVCIVVGVFPCILGIIFAIIAICDKSKKKGLAIVGLSCSVVGLLIFVPWFIYLISPTETEQGNTTNVYASEEVVKSESIVVEKKSENVVIDESIVAESGVEAEQSSVAAQKEEKESKDDGYGVEHYLAMALLVGFFLLIAWASIAGSADKTPKYDGKPRKCPRCGGGHFHVFVQEEVVAPAKIKSKTTLNMNPLKPFTVFNHKQKVVRQQITRNVSRFVCDDCGNIFQ